MDFYPIAVNLKNRLCVVVGGGDVGERKVRGLLEHGAHVRLVSPQAKRELVKLACEGKIEWRAQKALPQDLEGAFLVFLATCDRAVNDELERFARERGILVNRADAPERCDFIVPASFQAGNIEVAVFSGGEAPFFARWLRIRLENELSRNLGTMGELMSDLRAELKEKPIDQRRRAEILNTVLESDILEILRQQGKEAALAHARELVNELLQKGDSCTPNEQNKP